MRQFANVTGPGILQKPFLAALGNRLARHAVALVKLGQQGLCQFQNVVPPLAQGRHVEAEQVEPMEQVFAKSAFRDKQLEVPVRRRNDPDIHRNFPRAAHPPDFPVFNRGQYFGLHRRGEAGQFIQKQGPSVGRLEQSHAGCARVRERAPFVSEQF